MLDLESTELSAGERELLCHPLVGGVILFSRNYHNPMQLQALVEQIHALRTPQLLVAVDQEGGRVQRFRKSFNPLPAPAYLGALYDEAPEQALAMARQFGWLMAVELRALGVDISFAPVLDVRKAKSRVIGDRALHHDPEIIARLGRMLMRGMGEGGMAAVGKHFPGHGSVKEDSHTSLPVDNRSLETIRLEDMLAFERMFHYGLPAVMPAHVLYPEVDRYPAGFSRIWLEEILRRQLNFQGAIFSDDLTMAGAAMGGNPAERAQLALEAGCDMALVCNDRAGAIRILEELRPAHLSVTSTRLARLHGRHPVEREALQASEAYKKAVQMLSSLHQELELDFGEDTPA